MAMKVNELMIGDWVNVNGLNLKVGAIHADEIGVVDPDYKIYWCSDDEFDRIDPIPLTEEILAKNGWFALDEYRYEGDVALAKESRGFRLKNTNICVNSVHQLQHLLWLVGVQKEIVL